MTANKNDKKKGSNKEEEEEVKPTNSGAKEEQDGDTSDDIEAQTVTSNDTSKKSKSKKNKKDNDQDDKSKSSSKKNKKKKAKKDDNDDDETPETVQDENAEHDPQVAKKRQSDRRRACCMFWTGVLAVIAATVLLVLGLGKMSDTSSKNKDNNNDDYYSSIYATFAPAPMDQDATDAATDETGPTEEPPFVLTPQSINLPYYAIKAIFDDDTSPQSQAFDWLRADEDNLGQYTIDQIRERWALAVLYYSTDPLNWRWADAGGAAKVEESMATAVPTGTIAPSSDATPIVTTGTSTLAPTDGYNPTRLNASQISSEYFLTYEHDACEWFLPGFTAEDICGTNNGTLLQRLPMVGMGLQGSLPYEVAAVLTQVQQLELGENLLTGRLPTEIGLMTQLQTLDVRYNQFRGQLPKQFYGILPPPPEIPVVEMDNTTRRHLQQMQTLPPGSAIAIGQAPPTEPPTPTAKPTLAPTMAPTAEPERLLEHLWLDGNQFTGTINENIGAWSNLRTLTLVDNLFSGAIPSSIGLSPLERIWLQDNELGNTLPTELGMLSDTLIELTLSRNSLGGDLITELAALTKLQVLEMDNNVGLRGVIVSKDNLEEMLAAQVSPISLVPLDALTDLQVLSMYNMLNIKGTIPDSLCGISELVFNCTEPGRPLCGCDCACPGAPTLPPGMVPPTQPPVELLTMSPTVVAAVTQPPSISPNDEELLVVAETATTGPTSAPVETASATDPIATEFFATDSVPTEPIVIDPVPTEPIVIDPLPTESVVMDPLPTEQVVTEPPPTEPVASVPVATEPIATEPLPTEAIVTSTLADWNLTAGERAMNWVKADPAYESYDAGRKYQRYALAALYYATQSPECYLGPMPAEIGAARQEEPHCWTTTTGWLSYNVHECSWFSKAIPCQVKQGAYLEEGSSENNLIFVYLALPSNNLWGSLPPELFYLTDLEVFDLQGNQLIGEIPKEIALLSNLEAMLVADNALSGTLPESINKLGASLQRLDAGNNNLVGTFPSSVWRLLYNLRELALDNNQMQGPLDTNLAALTQLEILNLAHNQFTGTLPDLALRRWQNMLRLDLSHNQLNAVIPTTIGSLVSLEKLWLNDNNFQGSIPTQLFSLQRLRSLLLHNNPEITGRLPLSVPGALQTLMVNATQVEGRISADMCGLKNFDFTCSESLCGCDSCLCP